MVQLIQKIMLAVVADQLNQLLVPQEETIQTILTEQAVAPLAVE
tara:strand:- start:150 stop:281 length:132 start_codon:yes stop_codon:yes gene_type:complete